jgi:hypothetical protein
VAIHDGLSHTIQYIFSIAGSQAEEITLPLFTTVARHDIFDDVIQDEQVNQFGVLHLLAVQVDMYATSVTRIEDRIVFGEFLLEIR